MDELIQKLIAQVGLGEGQAKGVLGLLFKLVKEEASSGDFSQIADLLPGVESLISQAPKLGGLGGMLGGLAGAVGGGKLGNLASLAGGLKALDIDRSKVDDIVSTVTTFLQDKGAGQVLAILKRVLA